LPSGRKNTYLLSARNLPGMFIERSWFPKGYVSVPHVHNGALYVTILSGSGCLVFGNKVDTTMQTKCAGPGSFVVIPADQPHWEWFKEDCLMQIEGIGPSNTFFLNQDTAAVKK
jgi:quercetin dioxygenase-like cupin family protein